MATDDAVKDGAGRPQPLLIEHARPSGADARINGDHPTASDQPGTDGVRGPSRSGRPQRAAEEEGAQRPTPAAPCGPPRSPGGSAAAVHARQHRASDGDLRKATVKTTRRCQQPPPPPRLTLQPVLNR